MRECQPNAACAAAIWALQRRNRAGKRRNPGNMVRLDIVAPRPYRDPDHHHRRLRLPRPPYRPGLAKRGYRIRVACRRPDLAGHVQPLGTPGQIMPVQANVRYPDSLAAVCDGAHAVDQPDRRPLQRRRAELRCRSMSSAPRRPPRRRGGQGAELFIQMSALGADANSPSEYARSKAEGEARARAAFPGRHHHPALDRVRTRGRFLQPLRRHGALLAGPAADRRRHDQVPAGLRRRRRRGDRPPRRCAALAIGRDL